MSRRLMRWKTALAILVLMVVIGGGVAVTLRQIAIRGSDRDDDDAIARPAGRVTIKDGVVLLTLSAAEQQDAGIATAHPVGAPAQQTGTGYGLVLDPTALTELSGRCGDAASRLQMADARLTVSRAAFARAKLLHREQQNVSVAQLQAAEGEFAVDEAVRDAARAQWNAIADSVRLQWGDVISRAVLDRTPLLADLVARHDYLVKVTLPPGEMLTLPAGEAVAHAAGGAIVHLHFLSVATTTDLELQGITYLYEASAQPGVLPGLRLEVSVPAGNNRKDVVIPAAAVIWSEGRAWIFLRTAATRFERREVDLKGQAPDGGYVVSGLTAGSNIVVRGAQLLLSEEFRAQAPIED